MTENAALRSLTRRRLGLLAAYAVTVAAYAAAILLILLDLRSAVAVVNVATLFYLLVVRRMDKKYDEEFAAASLQYGCGHCLEDTAVRARARDALSHAQAEELGLLPTRESGGVAASMELTGRADDIRVKVCEATLCYDLPQGSSHKVGLKNGVWMQFRFAGALAHTVLVPESVMDEAICEGYYQAKGLHRFAKAPEGWAVFTANDLDAARLLHKSAALLRKAEKSQSDMIFAVSGDTLAAYLFPRSLSFRTPLLGQLTSEILEWDRLPELGWLLELCRALCRRSSARTGQTAALETPCPADSAI